MTFAEVMRFAGLLIVLTVLPLLVFGVSALDCLVVAVVGYALLRVGAP